MDLRDMEKEEFEIMGDESVESLFQVSTSLALLDDDDQVIGLQGFYEYHIGVGQVWSIPSIHIKKHIKSYVKMYQHMMDEYFWDNSSYWRAQTWSVDDDLHNRWMKFVGFDFEGQMKKFGPTKKNYNIWAVVKDG